MATLTHKRTDRNRNIRHALLTSLFARITSILLQVVSLPIAAVQLGPAGFSIYAMIGAILAAMTLSNLGLGQATTLHMSRALATSDLATGRKMMTVSLLIVGVIAITVSTVMSLLVLFTPLLSLVFVNHLEDTPLPIAATLFVCFVFFATQILSVLEAAQLAQQRQHRLNIALSVGTIVSAISVWWSATNFPSVISILLALHLPIIIVRAINAGTVWADLRPKLGELASAVAHGRSILTDGLRFVAGTTVANFLCHPFSVLAVGMFAAPLPSASYAAVMNAVILASSVLALIVTPFRGALPEAYKRGDHDWIRYSIIRILGFNLAYGTVVCVTFAAFGQWLFKQWYGGVVNPSQTELLGAGIYFLLLAVEVANFTFLSNIGYLKTVSRWMLIKSIFSALGILAVTALERFEFVFWVLIANNLVFSLFPLIVITLIPLRFKQHDRT